MKNIKFTGMYLYIIYLFILCIIRYHKLFVDIIWTIRVDHILDPVSVIDSLKETWNRRILTKFIWKMNETYSSAIDFEI